LWARQGTFGFYKRGGRGLLLDQLNNYQLLKKDSAPWFWCGIEAARAAGNVFCLLISNVWHQAVRSSGILCSGHQKVATYITWRAITRTGVLRARRPSPCRDGCDRDVCKLVLFYPTKPLWAGNTRHYYANQWFSNISGPRTP
jgi:hypothetical protein